MSKPEINIHTIAEKMLTQNKLFKANNGLVYGAFPGTGKLFYISPTSLSNCRFLEHSDKTWEQLAEMELTEHLPEPFNDL
jgi:hypothetical protein